MKHDARRVGGFTIRRGKYYGRVRLGKGIKRYEPPMTAVHDDATATTRAAQIAKVADMLVAIGRLDEAKKVAVAIGACATEREVLILIRGAELVCERSSSIAYGGLTFAQFAERWTSGQLHHDHPDHVADKQHEGDINILKNRILPFVGPLPIAAFTLEDADRVMRELPTPPAISQGYRRAVAQVVHRVIALAVYPAKVLKANPLPKGWLPKIGKAKAKSFLYPKEEAALLANRDIDIRYRMLLGFLTREGMRKSEARLADWNDFDLVNGTVTLDENKTDSPRSWPLSPDVVRALVLWKKVHGGKGPFLDLDVQHLGEHFRDWLRASGVDRPQLFKASDKRIHMRAHDTRTTFVTLSLAADRSESWVMRRTAHKSSTMIAKYTVGAANARELGLGPLHPLDTAIPELAEETMVPTTNELKRAGGERGRLAQARARMGEQRVSTAGLRRASKVAR